MSGFDPRDERCKREILRVAVARLRGLRKERQDYDDEVAEWYSRGNGRSPKWVAAGTQPWFDPEIHDPFRWVNVGGRGHRFPYCIHGVKFTEYDVDCGACEEGTDIRWIAHAYAWNAVKDMYERTDLMMQMINLHAPREAVHAVGAWVSEGVRVHEHRNLATNEVHPATPGLFPPLDPRRLP